MADVIALLGGGILQTHDPVRCAGQVCCIHNSTAHHMVAWPQVWRSDWGGFMERQCPHGIGHPDPDDLAVRTVEGMGVHGCDGCCRKRKDEAP
ncbi:hypothetical protein [Paractinoplanes toevensis]|uniref:Uncharacterized protein n=1 Tax=Paractinoplanes toevensis TaxID=571911 RepID=A0A919T4S9_9ACTN|nr:hypothetical protein [Actinoplanes toevensis]GIM88873.1 hypothetical protein Ato02nite_006660 [Actinoplanes toevensis]